MFSYYELNDYHIPKHSSLHMAYEMSLKCPGLIVPKNVSYYQLTPGIPGYRLLYTVDQMYLTIRTTVTITCDNCAAFPCND